MASRLDARAIAEFGDRAPACRSRSSPSSASPGRRGTSARRGRPRGRASGEPGERWPLCRLGLDPARPRPSRALAGRRRGDAGRRRAGRRRRGPGPRRAARGVRAGRSRRDARREDDPLGVRYRASLALGIAGPWRVTVSVAGTDGSGALTFPVDVEPASRSWWAEHRPGHRRRRRRGGGPPGSAAAPPRRHRGRPAPARDAGVASRVPRPVESRAARHPHRQPGPRPALVQRGHRAAVLRRFGVGCRRPAGRSPGRPGRARGSQAPDRRCSPPSRGAPIGSGSACSRSTATSSRASSRSRCADA